MNNQDKKKRWGTDASSEEWEANPSRPKDARKTFETLSKMQKERKFEQDTRKTHMDKIKKHRKIIFEESDYCRHNSL